MYRIYSMLLLLMTLGSLHTNAQSITVSPTDTIICHGGNAIFSVTTTATPGSYRWQQYPGSDINDVNGVYSGTNTSRLTVHIEQQSGFRCIVTYADGSSETSDWSFFSFSEPLEVRGMRYSTPVVCAGTNGIIYAVNLGYYGTSTDPAVYHYVWSYSGTGIVMHPVEADSTVAIDFGNNATSGNLSIISTSVCGTTEPFVFPITVGPRQTVAGVPGAGPTCVNHRVTSDNSYADPGGCGPVTNITPLDNSGNWYYRINSCVTAETSVPFYNDIPYVQRYYNLEPQNNPYSSTASATITLYYTQSDFDNYNTARGSNPALPTGPSDATGISNLRITQFHGSGTTPGTYAGGSGEIDPDDNKIVWNAAANRWEVTFDIVGFSGFFVSGSSLITPLPLTLTAFSGRSNTNGNLLRWTTASEENTATFEIQRSDNASGAGNYHTIATLPAAGNSRQPIDYTYTDANVPQSASVSYRLRMTDLDGSFTFSRILTLHPGQTSLGLRILPNPSAAPQYIAAHATLTGNATLTVTDLSGKPVLRKNITLQAGDNSIEASALHTLQRGFYLLTLDTDGQKQTIKFIKE